MLVAALLLAALDGYAVTTLLPSMLTDISLSVDRLQEASPIVGGFLVGYVAALPLFGAASDARGRLPAAVAGLAVFAAGSVVTALAQNLPVLVVGRALQGLGGGALVPVALASVADLYTGRRRELALGMVIALQELGSVVGPVYGLLVATLLHGWRTVFLLNLPLALILGAALLRPPLPAAPDPAAGRRSLDVPSAVALGAGLALLAAALYPDQPEVRAINRAWPLLAVAGLLLISFYAMRQRGALAWRPALAGSLVANLLVGAGLIAVLVFVPVFARAVLSVDQRQAGLLLTAFLAGVPLGAVVGGALAGRVGLRAPAAAGLGLAALLFFVLSGWKADELHRGARAYLELASLGVGFGLTAAPLAAGALDAAAPRSQGFVSSLVVAARTMGMVMALSALTAYGLTRVTRLVAERGSPPPGLSLREQLRWAENAAVGAFVVEFHEIFLFAAGFSAVGALVALVTLGERRTAAPTAPS